MRLTHKAGDEMQIDYAGKKLELIDKRTGEVCPVEVLVLSGFRLLNSFLISSCKRVLEYCVCDYKMVQSILEKGLDQLPDSPGRGYHITNTN